MTPGNGLHGRFESSRLDYGTDAAWKARRGTIGSDDLPESDRRKFRGSRPPGCQTPKGQRGRLAGWAFRPSVPLHTRSGH